jgi:hypothetical protein
MKETTDSTAVFLPPQVRFSPVSPVIFIVSWAEGDISFDRSLLPPQVQFSPVSPVIFIVSSVKGDTRPEVEFKTEQLGWGFWA